MQRAHSHDKKCVLLGTATKEHSLHQHFCSEFNYTYSGNDSYSFYLHLRSIQRVKSYKGFKTVWKNYRAIEKELNRGFTLPYRLMAEIKEPRKALNRLTGETTVRPKKHKEGLIAWLYSGNVSHLIDIYKGCLKLEDTKPSLGFKLLKAFIFLNFLKNCAILAGVAVGAVLLYMFIFPILIAYFVFALLWGCHDNHGKNIFGMQVD